MGRSALAADRGCIGRIGEAAAGIAAFSPKERAAARTPVIIFFIVSSWLFINFSFAARVYFHERPKVKSGRLRRQTSRAASRGRCPSMNERASSLADTSQSAIEDHICVNCPANAPLCG
ncbi:hypothetical protein [Chelativorans sp. ZYF759]|uniref:hypothetical protein n=1 Tax=Chelativorans sp. ZYF759 TaxID=2692213 RepID=UPI001FEEACE2|nr:hypothetical protein [Chelativorans sp. ZYF759]